jgi:pseudaminic acid biosynthesis-associated protein PseG
MILRPRILFIANAGPTVGGGHVMRSLTLARALAEHGADCVFLAAPAVAEILDVFGPELNREEAVSLEPAAIVRGAVGMPFDAVVFDHYGLSREEHEAIAAGRPSLIIDDLADRPLGGSIILDPGPARTAEDYAGLTEAPALLLGPAYAPVRPEFAALREQAIARRGGPVERVLVALGLTDVGGVTSHVVDRLRRRNGDVAFDVVLGSRAPSLPGLRRVAAHDPRVSLHVDAQNMAELTLNADVAIGAGGSTTWERCVLGLPSALVVLAPNQRPAALALAEREAALLVEREGNDFDAALDRVSVRLIKDATCRARLTAASLELCDGLGAERAAGALLEVISGPRKRKD